MVPIYIVTYLYGSGTRTVTLKLETLEKFEGIKVEVVEP